ncbi:ABC transporter permease [Nocardioides sp. WV_118_6]|uniref:ABC transporter permease n=1 Tax=Pimelobacter TaxID=2044 RepID=UPI001C04E0E4|nr:MULTISPECIES: ABC transporter permease [Pimelobacter]MBU2695358.1 peptide ABC transporter permease [Pimelobacter sp. 30-1]UUW91266.1 ABC transporter permease [Pimelobacter simplex]UUW95094.1 ABC transporter permease [Pimelobacter simplex]
MTRYLLSRLGSALLVTALASIGIFALIRLVPGDPVTVLAGPDATPAARDAIRTQLGLDQPFWSQYVHWLGDLARFDLGPSYKLGGDVGSLIADGALNTVVLTLFALVLATVGAIVTSTAAVVGDRRWLNSLLSALNTAAVAVPTFATALVLVLVFAVRFPVLPAGGTPPAGFFAQPDIALQYLILPGIALALPAWAALTRFLTEALRTQMRQPYVTTARALGIPRRRIVLTQALRNALPSTVTVLGLQLGTLLGGAILVEAVFAWPGLGRLVEQGISARDYPVVQVLLLLSVVVFVLTQLATDVIHAWLDPRVRLNGVS